MSELYDMKVSGSGTIPGGEYKDVKISGSGDIVGDIKCDVVGISGSGNCRGKINSKEIKVSGSFTCNGSVEVEELIKISGSGRFGSEVKSKEIRVSGNGDFNGNVKAEEVKISGGCNIKGNVSFNTMKISGGVDIQGDCEGTEFIGSGAGSISGLLSADKIEVNVADNWRIKEIGGEEIIVKKENVKKFLFLTFIFRNKGKLITDCIEGDNINLEYTECKIVRGHNITIGEVCNIEKVEYSGNLTIDDKSTVGEKIWMKS